jgi:hypothetical protein
MVASSRRTQWQNSKVIIRKAGGACRTERVTHQKDSAARLYVHVCYLPLATSQSEGRSRCVRLVQQRTTAVRLLRNC